MAKEPESVRFYLRVWRRPTGKWIGQVRLVDEEPTGRTVPFTDFCDLRDKVKEMMSGKKVVKPKS